jgi:hypothetical protein
MTGMHLVEFLAATKKFGVDHADLVDRLAPLVDEILDKGPTHGLLANVLRGAKRARDCGRARSTRSREAGRAGPPLEQRAADVF